MNPLVMKKSAGHDLRRDRRHESTESTENALEVHLRPMEDLQYVGDRGGRARRERRPFTLGKALRLGRHHATAFGVSESRRAVSASVSASSIAQARGERDGRGYPRAA